MIGGGLPFKLAAAAAGRDPAAHAFNVIDFILCQ